MKATTLKVDGEQVRELERSKPASQSVSAYVRSVLQREVLRQKMGAVAECYTELSRSISEIERDGTIPARFAARPGSSAAIRYDLLSFQSTLVSSFALMETFSVFLPSFSCQISTS